MTSKNAAKLSSGRVVCFARDQMGDGPQELGHILIQAFVNNLQDSATLPETIVCYNAGARLAAEDSKVAPALRHLMDLGVEILVCGTCVDYFNLRGKLAAGVVSNMHDIVQRLMAAATVIYP